MIKSSAGIAGALTTLAALAALFGRAVQGDEPADGR
jgi:hypothetical protein